MIYHSSRTEEVFSEVKSSLQGLQKDEAAKRLSENGPNAFASEKKKSLLRKFFEQFKDVMIIVLIAAAILSAAIAVFRKEYSELIDSGIILLIVIINAIIGLVQENKAEEAFKIVFRNFECLPEKEQERFKKLYDDFLEHN